MVLPGLAEFPHRAADDLLAGGLGALPLALLTDDAKGRLGKVVDRLDERLRRPNVPDGVRKLLLASGHILLGLRYNKPSIDAAFRRANAMLESSTYQGILEDGRIEGRREARRELIQTPRDTLVDVLTDRFGPLPAELVADVASAVDAQQLRSAIRAAGRAANLAEFHIPTA